MYFRPRKTSRLHIAIEVPQKRIGLLPLSSWNKGTKDGIGRQIILWNGCRAHAHEIKTSANRIAPGKSRSGSLGSRSGFRDEPVLVYTNFVEGLFAGRFAEHVCVLQVNHSPGWWKSMGGKGRVEVTVGGDEPLLHFGKATCLAGGTGVIVILPDFRLDIRAVPQTYDLWSCSFISYIPRTSTPVLSAPLIKWAPNIYDLRYRYSSEHVYILF